MASVNASVNVYVHVNEQVYDSSMVLTRVAWSAESRELVCGQVAAFVMAYVWTRHFLVYQQLRLVDTVGQLRHRRS